MLISLVIKVASIHTLQVIKVYPQQWSSACTRIHLGTLIKTTDLLTSQISWDITTHAVVYRFSIVTLFLTDINDLRGLKNKLH